MSIRQYMEGMLPCTAPYLQITVTLSTPTAHYTHYPAPPRSVVIRRVESRTGAVTVVSRWVCDSAFASSPQSGWPGPVSCSRSSNRTGRFPASGSRKRLMLSPTEDLRYGVVTAPSRKQHEAMLPENACNPVAAPCAYRRATDAASSGRAYRPRCRLC